MCPFLQQGACALPNCETVLVKVTHVRTVCWGQLPAHAQHPDSWNELEVDDAADISELKRQVVIDSSLLILQSSDFCQTEVLHAKRRFFRPFVLVTSESKSAWPSRRVWCAHNGNMSPFACALLLSVLVKLQVSLWKSRGERTHPTTSCYTLHYLCTHVHLIHHHSFQISTLINIGLHR